MLRVALREQFCPPFGGLIPPAPCLVEPDDPLARLCDSVPREYRGYFPLASLEAFVTLNQQRLGFDESLLSDQGNAEQRLASE